MSTKTIKYSEIKDNVNSENLNSDVAIEMHPMASETNSDIQITSSGSEIEARVSEIALDMQPNEVLVNNTNVITVNPKNPDQAPSVSSTNRSD